MLNPTFDSSGREDATSLYLDLLKRSLVNWFYGHTVMNPMVPWSYKRRLVKYAIEKMGLSAAEAAPIPLEMLQEGKGICANAYTLVGLKRLANVEFCVRDVLAHGVPGDLLEAGVWKGGTCIFMRGILKAFGVTDRNVWVADSFKGLPTPNIEKYPQDKNENLHEADVLSISLEEVRQNFERYGLLDDQVKFLEGYFCDTLPTAPIDRLAVLRLDGDMYESTMDTLVSLYPKLSPGGYLIVDDYARENCAQAVHDYRNENQISDEITEIDWTGAFWQKRKG